METVRVGLVADPAKPTDIARRNKDLGPVDGHLEWHIEVVSEPFAMASEDADTAMSRLVDLGHDNNWDLGNRAEPAVRVVPAQADRHDGRQTPYRNHPVFVAQHATATCCRSCLETWHGIAKGHRLDRSERAYVVEVIGRWIDRELAGSTEGRGSGSSTSSPNPS